MRFQQASALAAVGGLAGVLVGGPVSVDYTADAGGSNPNGASGLAARGVFEATGTSLTLDLTNISASVPAGAEVSDSLLVSIAFRLPAGVSIISGDAARIGQGSNGLGSWAGRSGGDSVAEEWLWTNDAGGDLLEAFPQVISTSNGQGSGKETLFGGGGGNVRGPFGGIAAGSPLIGVPRTQEAVSDTIRFRLSLSSELSMAELSALAGSAWVEFGSDYQYLESGPVIPLPTGAAMAAVGMGLLGTRRRR